MLRTVSLLLTALVAVAVAVEQQPIGGDKCTWGPSFWCANLENANACGALTTCQSMGMLLDTPAPLGVSRCTWGPVYTCANEHNARECHMLAACQKMGLLPADGDSGSTGEAVRRSVDTPLGVDKCTYGPSYWCGSVEQANECHTLKHCQSIGLLLDAPKAPSVGKPLGVNKCTFGPTYWCHSVDNANECKMLAHCQSMGLLTGHTKSNTDAPSINAINDPAIVSMPGMQLGNCAQGPSYWCASAANAKECQMEAQCAALGMTPSADGSKVQKLLGTNNCVQGPVYWCKSVENAKECKMLEECQRLKLLPANAGSEPHTNNQAPPVGAGKCTFGPSYWCASVDNANECKMLAHCQAMKLLPSDEVLQAANVERRAVKPVLGAKQCADGPAYWCASLDNANECKMLAHCQSLGLLPNVPAAQAPSSGHANNDHNCLRGPIFWCASVANAQLCGKLEHCRTLGLLSVNPAMMPVKLSSAPLPAGDKLAGLTPGQLKGVECDVCVEVMKLVDEVLETNSTESVILEGLEDLCNDLPTSLTSECTYFVNTYGPELVNFLITDILAPQTICSEIGLCSSQRSHEIMRAALRQLFARRTVKGTECDICKDVLSALQSALQNPTTVQDILADVEEICDSAGPLKSVCISFIKEFGPKVLSYLASEIEPQAFCQDIGVCTAQRMLNGVPFPPSN